jgi:hypothetical protein
MTRLKKNIKAFTVFNFVTLGMFVSVADEALANASGYPVNKSSLKKEITSDRSSVPEDPCDTEPTKIKEKELEKRIL